MPSTPSDVDFFHRPALLEECLDYLKVAPGSIVVDCTVGGGGHAEAILERTAPDGALIGFDRDADAIDAASKRLARFGDRVELIQESFRNLGLEIANTGVERIDAVLIDLGVSSHQLDVAKRGFRFAADTADVTPLDMRMDQAHGTPAAELIRSASPVQLEQWFRDYADLRGARRLAHAIVEARRESPLRTAGDLRAVIHKARIGKGRRHDPSTLVFQALRIATNDELGALSEGVEQAIDALRVGGRIVVLAYHSAEDRIIKNQFRDAMRGCTCPPRMPVCICGGQVRIRVLTRRPTEAGSDEIQRNPRARSARLRAAERVAEAL